MPQQFRLIRCGRALSGPEIKALTAERVARYRRIKDQERLEDAQEAQRRLSADLWRMAAGAGIALLLIAMPYRAQMVGLGVLALGLWVWIGRQR